MEKRTESAALGRPRKSRALHAGDKLRMAFTLLQKTWGSNTSVQNHIFNMKRWNACGLPRSIKTVKEDIRCGIAYDRLPNYASLLNISSSILSDESTSHTDPNFISAIINAKTDIAPPSIMLQNVFGTAVNEKFLDFNRHEYIKELFELINGFYIVYLMKVPPGIGINKMVMAISNADAYCLRVKSKFYLETDLNSIDGEMHRWGSFLYANFYMNEMQSFAMAMLHDPMRNPVLAARKPFYMTGKYLFGSEAFGKEPLFAVFHMERRQHLPDENWDEAFEAFCLEHLSYQFLFPGEPEHDYALARLRSTVEGTWDFGAGQLQGALGRQ